MAGLKTIAPLKTVKPLATNDIPAAVKAPPPTKYEGRPPVDPNKPVIYGRGLEVLGLGIKRGLPGGPGLAPTGFEGSQPEWVWYYASKRVMEPNSPIRSRGRSWARRMASWAFTDPIGESHALRVVGNTTPDFTYMLGSGVADRAHQRLLLAHRRGCRPAGAGRLRHGPCREFGNAGRERRGHRVHA